MRREQAATVIIQALLRGQNLTVPLTQVRDIHDGQIMVTIENQDFLLSVEEW